MTTGLTGPIKELTTVNWLEPDRVVTLFKRLDEFGQAVDLTGEDWASLLLAPSLQDSVPLDLHTLFEVARGALLYGFFFYPLYTLGTEQLFRVIDAASVARCAAIGAPPGVRSFRNRVEYLVANGVIAASDAERWRNHVNLRNAVSHPDQQMILTPGLAVGLLRQIADDISHLFE